MGRGARRAWAAAAVALGLGLCTVGCGSAGYSPSTVQADEAAAGRLFTDMAAGRWNTVEAAFDAKMQSGLPAARLQAAWVRAAPGTGAALTQGRPTAQSARGDLVVDIPLQWPNKSIVGRVAFDPAGRVVGLLLLP